VSLGEVLFLRSFLVLERNPIISSNLASSWFLSSFVTRSVYVWASAAASSFKLYMFCFSSILTVSVRSSSKCTTCAMVTLCELLVVG
jgi:hypothetical protein